MSNELRAAVDRIYEAFGKAHRALLAVKEWDIEYSLGKQNQNMEFNILTLPLDVRQKIQSALDAAKAFGFHED